MLAVSDKAPLFVASGTEGDVDLAATLLAGAGARARGRGAGGGEGTA